MGWWLRGKRNRSWVRLHSFLQICITSFYEPSIISDGTVAHSDKWNFGISPVLMTEHWKLMKIGRNLSLKINTPSENSRLHMLGVWPFVLFHYTFPWIGDSLSLSYSHDIYIIFMSSALEHLLRSRISPQKKTLRPWSSTLNLCFVP